MKERVSRIYLTGFMGCGKSSIGLILANTLGWKFIDLDDEIIKSEKMSITEIFKIQGESVFRDIEARELHKMENSNRVIVALGGGAILRESNIDLMKATGKLIYIKASPEKIYSRLKLKTNRPLFQTADNLIMTKENAILKIRTMMNEREKYYLLADLIFSPEDYSIGYCVDKLRAILFKKYGIENAEN